MIELTTVNTGRGQICIDDKFGLLFRSHSSKYFYAILGDKKERILRNQDKYIILPENSVPRDMIRKDYKSDDNISVMCLGCGKIFKKRDMDGGLCRGFDGCSVKKEIGELRSSFGLRDSRSFL
jgi:hypothetical protein